MMIEKNTLTGINPEFTEPVFDISDIHPNPSNYQIGVNLKVNDNMVIEISIINVIGQQVQIISKNISAGTYPLKLNVSDLDAGIYYLMMIAGDRQITQKFIVQ